MDDRTKFQRSMEAIRVQLNTAFALFCHDAKIRLQYNRSIAALALDLETRALRGELTWARAAEQASAYRNVALDLARGRSTPIGRAIAESLKSAGIGLNEAIARYTIRRHGASAIFAELAQSQQQQIFADIVGASGRSRANINRFLHWGSRAGRGFIVLALAVSVYNIATAEDRSSQAAREAAVLGSGIAGGVVAGALAGLACGPGAPVCVAIGAFVGGAYAAFKVDSLFD